MKMFRKIASPYGLANVSLLSFWLMLPIFPSGAYDFHAVFFLGVCLPYCTFPAFIPVRCYIAGSPAHVITSPFQPFFDLLRLSGHVQNIAIYPRVKLPADHKHKLRMQPVYHFPESVTICHLARCRKAAVCRNCGNGSFRQAIKTELIAFSARPRCHRYYVYSVQRQPPRQRTAPVHLPDLQRQRHIPEHGKIRRTDVLEVAQHFKILSWLIPQLFKFAIMRKEMAQGFLRVLLFRRRCERNRL